MLETQKKTPGEIIKEFREKAGLTIEQLEGITKIHHRILKLIEEDNWTGAISFSNYQGLIKILAREFKFNPEIILNKRRGAISRIQTASGAKKRIFLLPIIFPVFNYFYYFLFFTGLIFILHGLSRIYAGIFWHR